MKTELDLLREALVRARRDAMIGALLPGVPEEDVRREFVARGLIPSTDLVDLYAWSRGTLAETGLTLGQLSLFPGFYLLSLDDALANYDAFASDERWSSAWFPVFADGGGDFYVVDLDTKTGAFGAVRRFRIEYEVHPIEYGSLADQIRTIVAALDAGVISVDPRGYLRADPEAFAAIAQRTNPQIAWWSS